MNIIVRLFKFNKKYKSFSGIFQITVNINTIFFFHSNY